MNDARYTRQFSRIILFVVGGFAFIFSTSCASLRAVFPGLKPSDLLSKETVSSLSETGAAISKAAEAITPEQEYYIGRAVAANILNRYRLASDRAMEKYLNSICGALVVNSDKPELFRGYHVAIMDTNEINAFATSGGHILISKGLLKCTDSEDALAAVIAHEIAHIQLQHGIRAIKSSRSLEAIVATAKSATVILGGSELTNLTKDFGKAVNEVMKQMVEKGYSREQEYEADRMALDLMIEAGYAPEAMIDMLKLLDEKLGSAHTGFGKTHPSPKNRLTRVELNLLTMPKDGASSEGYKLRSERFKKQ